MKCTKKNLHFQILKITGYGRTDRRTDQPTDGLTDGRTDHLIEMVLSIFKLKDDMWKRPKMKVDFTQISFYHCWPWCLKCSETTLPILNGPSFTGGRWLYDPCIQINYQKPKICFFSFKLMNIAAKCLRKILAMSYSLFRHAELFQIMYNS